jgi:hypothetical protein
MDGTPSGLMETGNRYITMEVVSGQDLCDVARQRPIGAACRRPCPSAGRCGAAMKDAILRKARESAEVKTQFIAEHAEQLERCVRTMAERFRAGGRLWVMGNGGSACDAQHVAVEFMHPILEKRRAALVKARQARASKRATAAS